jgi:ArsR family transcriptional regulator
VLLTVDHKTSMFVNIPGRIHRMASTTTLPVVVAPACCGIGADGGLTREAAETSAALLKAVADPVRLQLLSAIRSTDAGEACVCDLTPLVGLSQPTVSHHLKVLVEAGLLEREKRGTWAWFRLVPSRLDDVAAIFR